MPAGLPNEEDILARGGGDNELEVSVVDDTPEQDRGRTPLSKEKLKQALEPSDEEMERYSADVKKRILQLQHAAHDQRRIAEEALRERAAAEEFAKAQLRKTQELQSRFAAGEKVFVGGMQEKAKVSIEAAEAELKAATEAFDADAIVKANRKLTTALMEEQRYANWQPQPPSQAVGHGQEAVGGRQRCGGAEALHGQLGRVVDALLRGLHEVRNVRDEGRVRVGRVLLHRGDEGRVVHFTSPWASSA